MVTCKALLQTAILIAAWTTTGWSLERGGPVPAGETDSPWEASASCTVTYANICTGWMWYWYLDWDEMVGVVFEPCCGEATLETTSIRFSSSSIGYGAQASVHTADENGCPTVPLGDQSFWIWSNWMTQNWGIPCPGPIVLAVSPALYWSHYSSVACFVTHPSQGPTGPAACGHCYPVGLPPHTFNYGRRSDPLCPPEFYTSDGCPLELVCSATFSCPSETTPSTWAAIKALYR